MICDCASALRLQLDYGLRKRLAVCTSQSVHYRAFVIALCGNLIGLSSGFLFNLRRNSRHRQITSW